VKGTVTRDDINRLKRELDTLRTGEIAPGHSATLIESMERLQLILEKLVRLFEHAERDVYEEYEQGVHDELAAIKQVQADVAEVKRQNEKIAAGIVALADILKQQRKAAVPSDAPAMPAPPPQQDRLSRADAIQALERRSDDTSFLRQQVGSMQLPQSQTPPAPPVRSFAPRPPPPPPMARPQQQAAPMMPPLPAFPQQPAGPQLQWQAEPATIVQGQSLPQDLPPPREPASDDQGRRGLLNKFSFR
jgi:hypothetical protein